MYLKNKPFYEKADSFTFNFQREKYKKEHSYELNQFYIARRKVNEFWKGRKCDWIGLRKESDQLNEERYKKEQLYRKCSRTAKNAFRIKCIAEEMLENNFKNREVSTPVKEKNSDMEL